MKHRPILILLPSLGRNDSQIESIKSLNDNGTGLFDLIVLGGIGGAASALNRVPMELIDQYQIIGLFADDVRMRTPNWDQRVCDRLCDKGGMVYGRDGLQDERLGTHPFVAANVFTSLGFIQPRCLIHFYTDTFLRDLLSPLGKSQYDSGLFTEHLHPETGKSLDDATYQMARSHWEHDTSAYGHYRAHYMEEDRKKIP